MHREEKDSSARAPYWYRSGERSASAVAVLQALRRFRAADSLMRRRAQSAMSMNETDLVALRHLIACERDHEPVSPKDLSVFLDISSAATAKLLTRMVKSGHIRRAPHPSDRRAQRLYATDEAHADVRGALGAAHERMLAVATSLNPQQQEAVMVFLDAMTVALAEED